MANADQPHDPPFTEPWRNRIVGRDSVPPESLTANPRNWRAHPRAQRRALAGVLGQVGWVQDVIVNRRTGHILDGHLRVALAVERGEAAVPIVVVDLTPEEEAVVLATFDPLGAMAATDGAALQALLTTVETEDAAVRTLLGRLAQEGERGQPAGDPDAVPPLAPQPTSEPGDLWGCGDHRVLCGDATDPAVVARAVDGEPAEWCWTDPPYGVGYAGKTPAALRLEGDEPDTVAALLRDAFAAVDRVLAANAPLFVAHPAGPLSHTFGAAFLAVGWQWHATLIWVKNRFVLGRGDFHYRHEPILYGWKPGRSHAWYGGRDRDSVFEVARAAANRDHPTAKPVALITAQLQPTTLPGSLGLDPFAGSGSTLIAADQLGRRCAAVEIDPRYVDVAVRRWEACTGGSATLAQDGRTFAAITEARRGG